MEHIVSISSGLSSAIAGERVMKRYPWAQFVFKDESLCAGRRIAMRSLRNWSLI